MEKNDEVKVNKIFEKKKSYCKKVEKIIGERLSVKTLKKCCGWQF